MRPTLRPITSFALFSLANCRHSWTTKNTQSAFLKFVLFLIFKHLCTFCIVFRQLGPCWLPSTDSSDVSLLFAHFCRSFVGHDTDSCTRHVQSAPSATHIWPHLDAFVLPFYSSRWLPSSTSCLTTGHFSCHAGFTFHSWTGQPLDGHFCWWSSGDDHIGSDTAQSRLYPKLTLNFIRAHFRGHGWSLKTRVPFSFLSFSRTDPIMASCTSHQ